MPLSFKNNQHISDSDTVYIDFHTEPRRCSLQSHTYWELSYVYEGSGTHYTDNTPPIPIEKGEFIFSGPKISHGIASSSETGSPVRVCRCRMTQQYVYRILACLRSVHELDEFLLKRKMEDSSAFCLHMKDDSGSIYRLLMTAAHEYNHISHGSRAIMDHVFISLFIYIIRLYESVMMADTVSTTRDEVIDELIRYLRSHFGSPLTLQCLADHVHLSPQYVSRYFKKCTGRNIWDFLIQVRIDKAKYMLRTSHYSITDICAYCGFRSLSSFQKAFKKAVGMTAGAYRTYSQNLARTQPGHV